MKSAQAPPEADYDYVIVGGGSAGCVVANRLSANPKNRVLLLEAGGDDNWIWFHIPVGYLFAIGNPRSDWMYRTEAEPGLNGRTLAYPRGKVIGGSSAINAMISMRGQAADYDGWRALGLPGWGWSDVLPVFREIEDHFLGSSEHHGAGGEWRVEAPRLRWDVLDAVARAATEMGIAPVADFNAGGDEGVGYFHVNQKRGLRWSSARGFLDPVRKRDNLTVETGALVETLVLDGKRVSGVRYSIAGQNRLVTSRAEVVLCAGAIGTPHLLQRSGIGPAAVLGDAGIAIRHDLPGVGGNLQDHLQQRAIFRVSGLRTLNETYHSLPLRAAMGINFGLRRRGPLTMAPSQLGIFTRSSAEQQRANLQFHVQPLSLDQFGEPLHRFPAVTVSACNLRPTSRGSVWAISPHATDAPRIAPNYLSTHEDRVIAADAIRLTRRLMQQAAIRPYMAGELVPGPLVKDTDADLARAAGDIGTTIFHPVGTARMGTAGDPDAVVDARLRLIGLEGLRIADASVMPTIVSGNTNTPTIMIAAMAAKIILQDTR